MKDFRELAKLLEKFDCASLSEVTDITSQCEYTDTKSGDKISKVSCCQDDGYNELANKLKTYTAKYSNISKINILRAMCECCSEIKHQLRTHTSFDKCIENKLLLKNKVIGMSK